MSAELEQRCGALEQELRNLHAQYTGKGMKPQAGCSFFTAVAGDSNVLLEYEYEPGEPSQTSGPPERCYEGTPAGVGIIQALVNGRWCDPADVFAESLIERWAEQIAESEADVASEQFEDWQRERVAA